MSEEARDLPATEWEVGMMLGSPPECEVLAIVKHDDRVAVIFNKDHPVFPGMNPWASLFAFDCAPDFMLDVG